MLQNNHGYLHDFQSVFEKVMTAALAQTQTQSCSLETSLGRVVAEEVLAPISLPRQAISAMDGYGLVADTTEPELEVVAECFAGDTLQIGTDIESYQAVRIMTGAVIPTGVTAVLPQERACITEEATGEVLHTPESIQVGQNIKAAGSDVAKGQVLCSVGHRLTDRDIGLLASLGISQVKVFSLPKLALFTSGNELVAPSQACPDGKIYDANTSLLLSLVKRWPVQLVHHQILKDEPQEIEENLQYWADKTDIILTVGGASVGKKDYLSAVLSGFATFQSWKMNMKPAKPFSMAQLKQATILALPGNPVAAYMSAQLFAKPFVKKVAGIQSWQSQAWRMPLDLSGLESSGDSLTLPKGKQQWWQIQLTPQGVAPIPLTSSSQLTTLTQSQGFIGLQAGHSYQHGELVDVWRFD